MGDGNKETGQKVKIWAEIGDDDHGNMWIPSEFPMTHEIDGSAFIVQNWIQLCIHIYSLEKEKENNFVNVVFGFLEST